MMLCQAIKGAKVFFYKLGLINRLTAGCYDMTLLTESKTKRSPEASVSIAKLDIDSTLNLDL